MVLRTVDLPADDIITGNLKSFFVIREDQHIIAVIGTETFTSSALLRSLAVLPDHRNKNIASNLVGYTEKFLMNRKIFKIYLLTTTAVPFFQKHGYIQINRQDVPGEIQKTEEFARICPDSAVCMVKTIQ
jgi:amino-acid N-acetyltransferase